MTKRLPPPVGTRGFARPPSILAEAWNSEYRAGRYRDDPPLPFVEEILSAAGEAGLGRADGIYIGCGNGRNYLPLVAGGLNLVGLDISPVALSQLAERAPDLEANLVSGDLAALPAGASFAVVIGIQVFQHGDRLAAHANIRQAQRLLTPGGLFCLRVNAIGTDIEHQHELVEKTDDGSLTVRYLDGPKRGLDIHFFSEGELSALFAEFDVIIPPSVHRTWRSSPGSGQWSQWQAIWRKTERARIAEAFGRPERRR